MDNLSKASQLRYRGKKTRGKTTTLQSLDRKLWKVFSEYVRKRDRIPGSDIVICISCGKPVHWRYNCDAGHFANRRHKSTRFHEQNVNGQCKKCNGFEEGNSYAYGKALDKKYGEGTAEKLYNLSRIPSKLTRDWYEEQIKHYKSELQKMP